MRPVMAGLCRYMEVIDGTLDIGDIADLNEMLDVKEHNERIYYEHHTRTIRSSVKC